MSSDNSTLRYPEPMIYSSDYLLNTSRTESSKPDTASPSFRTPSSARTAMSFGDLYPVNERLRGLATITAFVPAFSQSKTFSSTSV